MKKVTISAAVATYNEEKNIVDLIESLNNVCDEIVIVDGQSQDKTVYQAKKNGAKVFSVTNKKMFQINKNLAIKKCTGDWIILMDADERISSDLSDEIKNLVKKKPKENGFWINRRNWFLGGYLKKGGVYPDSVIRLFKKGKGILPAKDVHEQMIINGEVGYLKNDILHLADPDFKRYLQRVTRYTDLTAKEMGNKNISKGFTSILFYMIIKPIWTFLIIFFRHKGYQDGFRGFVWAFFSGAHYFYAYSKYWHQTEK